MKRGAQLQNLRRSEVGAKIVGVFRVKNHDFTPKNHIFPNFKGGRTSGPSGSAPDNDTSFKRNVWLYNQGN
jgi:hypothetical protein